MGSKLSLFVVFLLGLIVWHLIHRWIFKRLRNLASAPRLFMVDKATFYIGVVLLIGMGLRMGGAAFSDVLATAGVLTVAIGFAAKTSMSQMISGLILLGGKIIQKDDLIEVGHYLGIIENIDIFSTRLRTFNNVLVSIPNEKLLTDCVTNYSQYPIRRISCDVLIRFEDLSESLIEDLSSHLKKIDELLVEPEATIVLETEIGRGLKLSVRAWCEASKVVKARNQLILEVASFFKDHEIHPCQSVIATQAI